MIKKIVWIALTIVLVLGMMAPAAVLAGQDLWELEYLGYGEDVEIEYTSTEPPPERLYVVCDEFEPYRNWCDEEVVPVDGECTQGMVKNFDSYGVFCHARMAYWSTVLDKRVVLDWYYSDDETQLGDYQNNVTSWRPCDYIQGGNIIHKTEGYQVNWVLGSYHGPWRATFKWNKKCDPPIKLLLRYAHDSPTYCEFFDC